MRTYVTNAPEAYDYGYTVSGPFRYDDEYRCEVRIVRIPAGNAQYQTDRYMSGMYFAKGV